MVILVYAPQAQEFYYFTQFPSKMEGKVQWSYNCMHWTILAKRELPSCLGINENSRLMIGRIFQRLASGSVSFKSCFSSTPTYPLPCAVGHFRLRIWSLVLSFVLWWISRVDRRNIPRSHPYTGMIINHLKRFHCIQMKCHPNSTSH